MRFYFDIHDEGTVTRDDGGMELPTLDAARIAAIVSLTEMAREWLPHDGNNRDISVAVRNSHKKLLRVSFRFEVQSLDDSVKGDDKMLAYDRQRN